MTRGTATRQGPLKGGGQRVGEGGGVQGGGDAEEEQKDGWMYRWKREGGAPGASVAGLCCKGAN